MLYWLIKPTSSFRPLWGLMIFIVYTMDIIDTKSKFSSPVGINDFYLNQEQKETAENFICFRPLWGLMIFIEKDKENYEITLYPVFVPCGD